MGANRRRVKSFIIFTLILSLFTLSLCQDDNTMYSANMNSDQQLQPPEDPNVPRSDIVSDNLLKAPLPDEARGNPVLSAGADSLVEMPIQTPPPSSLSIPGPSVVPIESQPPQIVSEKPLLIPVVATISPNLPSSSTGQPPLIPIVSEKPMAEMTNQESTQASTTQPNDKSTSKSAVLSTQQPAQIGGSVSPSPQPNYQMPAQAPPGQSQTPWQQPSSSQPQNSQNIQNQGQNYQGQWQNPPQYQQGYPYPPHPQWHNQMANQQQPAQNFMSLVSQMAKNQGNQSHNQRPSSQSLIKSLLYNAVADQLHTRVADAINVTFHWADHNYPLASRILQVAHAMGKTKIAQIQGAQAFLDIIGEATEFHLIKEKLDKNYKLPVKDFSNVTISDAIEEFSKHHNYTLADIPISQNLTSSITNSPIVKGLVKEALTTNINGVPFAFTLLFFGEHLGSNLKIGQLTNQTVLREIGRNVTRDIIYPVAEQRLSAPSKHFESQSKAVIEHIKNRVKENIDNFSVVAHQMSIKAFDKIKNATLDYIKYKPENEGK